MSKKKRKYGSKNKKRKLSAAQTYRPQAGAAPASTKKAGKRRAAQTKHHIPTEEELAEEYRYVLTDLKRIGILALVMLALLIALAIVLI